MFVDVLQEGRFLRTRRRGALQAQADGFLSKLRVGLLHFAIQHKGKVGVKLLLKLEELQAAGLPWARLDHLQKHFAGGLIEAEEIDNSRVFNSFGT